MCKEKDEKQTTEEVNLGVMSTDGLDLGLSKSYISNDPDKKLKPPEKLRSISGKSPLKPIAITHSGGSPDRRKLIGTMVEAIWSLDELSDEIEKGLMAQPSAEKVREIAESLRSALSI